VEEDQEIGLAVTAGGSQLPVDDARFGRETQNGGGDRRETACEDAAVAAVDLRG
jgi:hypothetical protein